MAKSVQCERCDSMAAKWSTASSAFLCSACYGSGSGSDVSVQVDEKHYDAIADKVLGAMSASDMMGVIKRLRDARDWVEDIECVDFAGLTTKAKEGVNMAHDAAAKMDEARKRLEKIIAEAELPKRVEFKRGQKITKVKGKQHKQLPLLADLVANRIDSYLGGPAGGGKNTACEQVARAAGLSFHTLQLSKLSLRSDLVGYVRPMDGVRVETAFSVAYEKGGLFAADELDNWNAGVLTSINSALANGFYTFPWGEVKRHPEFVFVGLGNTIGMGATANYSERTALSGASRDRLVFIDWKVDQKLERKLTDNDEWVSFVIACRKLNDNAGGQLLITPRATIQGTALLKLGWSRDQVVDSVLLRSTPVPSFLKETIASFVGGAK